WFSLCRSSAEVIRTTKRPLLVAGQPGFPAHVAVAPGGVATFRSPGGTTVIRPVHDPEPPAHVIVQFKIRLRCTGPRGFSTFPCAIPALTVMSAHSQALGAAFEAKGPMKVARPATRPNRLTPFVTS